MCGSSKNTTKQSSSQTTAPNQEAMAVYQDLLGRMKNVGADTYTPYAGTRVAEFSPDQQALLRSMMQPGGVTNDIYQNILNQSGQGYDPLKQEDINRFQNPWIDQVVNTTMQSMNRGFDRDVSKLKGDAISAGAFGGDRAGIAEATLRSQQGDQRAKMEADLRSQGFDQATSKALTELQIRNAARGQDINAQMGAAHGIQQGYGQAFGAGEAQRGLEQSKLDVPYEQYLEQRAFPYQQLQFLSGIGTGVGSQMGGTSSGTSKTTTPGPNLFSQLLGAGLGIAGMGTGSIGGSLLGFGRAEGGRVPDEARSYEPTWRDQLALLLLGEGKPSPEAARLVEGLLGSRGMGQTDMGLVDVTPVGSAFNTQEGIRSATEGDLVGAGMNFGDAYFAGMPAGAALKGGKSLIENLIDRRVAKELESTYPPDAVMHPGELDFMSKLNRENLSPRLRGFPELAPANQNQRLIPVGKAEGGTVLEDAMAMAQRLREDRNAVRGPAPQAEVRNYDPTLSDRLATMFLGEGKVAPESRRLVEGLLGTSGLGQTGPSVKDFVPGVSQVLNADEAVRNYEQGNYLGAMGDVIEGIGAPMGVTKGLGALLPAANGLRAFTPAHAKIAEETFVKLMTDPKISLNAKGLKDAFELEFVKAGLPIPDDIGRLTANTMKLMPQWTKPESASSVQQGIDLLRDLHPGRTIARAEGGEVERNWAGFDPATSRALFSAGMAMMAGRSPYFGSNVGMGGLAGMQSYDDYVNQQATIDYKNRQLAQEKELENEKLGIMRKQLEVKPEFDIVKDMVTKDGRPVVLNKATGRYHDASTGQPIDPNTGVQSIKKKYSDLPVGVQKEIIDTRNIIQSSGNAVSNLVEASKLNEQAYSGFLAGERGWVKSLTEDKEEGGPGTATEQLDNIITSGALESLKATFGAAPTEGERKILLDIQGSVTKAPGVRAKIFKRAIAAALAREDYNKRKAAAMVDGSYFTEGFDQEPLPLDSYLDVAEQLTSGGGQKPMRKQFRTKDGSLQWGVSKDGGKTWEPE